MQIKRLILYGRNGKVRTVEFRTGATNIITGYSKTGKSALIDILDYCLGSKDCAVAEGVIRNKVRYYGVVVVNGDEEYFICRPDPPTPQLTSAEIMVIVGSEVGVPSADDFNANFNPDSLKVFLTERLGIVENLSEPGITRRPLAANFRHALTFCFQEQGEIAQRGFLFHGSSDNFVALAIRDTLSYFLGAVDDRRPALRAELRDATRQLTLAERRLEEVVSIGGEGLGKGQSLLAEARHLGLDSSTGDAPDAADLESRLKAVCELAKSRNELPELPSDESDSVNRERSELMERFGVIQAQIAAYRNIGKDETGYEAALHEQKQRLESIGLFSANEESEHECPLCGSKVELPTSGDFQAAIESLAKELQGVEVSKPRLENVISNLEKERSQLSARLSANRLRAESLAAQDEEIRRSRDMAVSRARLSGRIELYLESGALDTRDRNAPLRNSVERTRKRVEEIQALLDSEITDGRIESILSIINRDITQMAAQLQLEHSGDPLRFDPDKLTVIADTINGAVPMARMGSGENWVAYHVLAHLALHRWFIRNGRPVPRLLILDQPSQVYFPSDTGSSEDVDMNSVRRIYQLVLRMVEEVAPEFQVIITDHVDDQNSWFQDAVIERWKDGAALVPLDW